MADEDPGRLSSPARDALEDRTNDLFVLSISVAEIEIKHRLGKLAMPHSCGLSPYLEVIVKEETKAAFGRCVACDPGCAPMHRYLNTALNLKNHAAASFTSGAGPLS